MAVRKKKKPITKKPATPVKRIIRKKIKPLPEIPIVAEVDDGEWDGDGLTFRQRRFVEALVGPAGGRQTVAAEMAGYLAENRNSLRATSCNLLTLPNVQRAIALALAARRMTPEWAKARLADIASADMANFVTIDANGQPHVDFKKAEAIGAIGQIKEYDPESGKLKLHDPAPALTSILKLYGLITDKHEHNTTGTVQLQFDLTKLNDHELAFLREIRLRASPELSKN